jgi:hypothetical protein
VNDTPGHYHPVKVTRFLRDSRANKTGFLGVSYRARDDLFYANIIDHSLGRRVYCGSSKTAEGAARLYDLKSIELYGNAINFPDASRDDLLETTKADRERRASGKRTPLHDKADLVLAYISSAPGRASARSIAKALCLSTGALCRAVGLLRERGLVRAGTFEPAGNNSDAP